jgi:nitrogen fixation NifU-like protein
MSELTDLYQAVILDHNRRPRNLGPLDDASGQADGKNPLCGDQLTVWVKLDGDTIADVRFVGQGCAISKASASLMTEAVKGRTVADARALFERFHTMVTTAPDQPVNDLGKLSVLAGVRQFPIRVKCASLAWHTLKAALASEKKATSE